MSKNIILVLSAIISSICIGVQFNNVKFSQDINTNGLEVVNNNIHFDKEKDAVVFHAGQFTSGIVQDDDINRVVLQTDGRIEFYTDEFDKDCENIFINRKPLNEIIQYIVSTSAYEIANSAANPLWRKKLTIVGDSESQGEFSYGNLIAKRNNMSVENKSYGGSSLVANPTDSSKSLLPHYREWIPEDTDYIIAHIGCNDGVYWNESIDDDSTDITTFKGAWNTFLQGLKTYYPNAKKAIMIHFYWDTKLGRDTRAKWMITRCKKYDLQYFDGVESFGFSPESHPQYFNEENGTPSPFHMSRLGHERASYEYEQFLKTRVQFSK